VVADTWACWDTTEWIPPFGPNQQNATPPGAAPFERTPILVSLRDELSLNVQPWLGLKLGPHAETIQAEHLHRSGTGTSFSADEGLLVGETSDWTFSSPSPYVEADVFGGRRPAHHPWPAAGFRSGFQTSDGAVAVDPRLAFRYKALLRACWSKALSGKYSQFPNYNELIEGAWATRELTTRLTPGKTPSAFEWDITPQLYLDVVGYYNHLEDLVVSNQGGFLAPLSQQQRRRARQQHLRRDLRRRHRADTNEGVGRTYWLGAAPAQAHERKTLRCGTSHTLSPCSERRREDHSTPGTRYAADRTHNLTVVAGATPLNLEAGSSPPVLSFWLGESVYAGAQRLSGPRR
jgi:hypothetical protein